MAENYIFNEDGSFTINDYNSMPPFSNFLPGIAGVWGVPLWVFYVNRAQGIASFGIQDKNHAIAEFFPASKAQVFIPSLGFRSFVKINNKFYEPFTVNSQCLSSQQMTARSASFEISEKNPRIGLSFKVKYFTLPGSDVGALVRVVTVKNTSNKAAHVEMLDGIGRIIPFGSSDLFLKYLARTLEAWMHSFIDGGLAGFKLIVNPQDVSQTKYIEGANFSYSFYQQANQKKIPSVIVDPLCIFGQDVSLSKPRLFLRDDFNPKNEQVTCGKTPCSFSYVDWEFKPGEEKQLFSVFGACFKQEYLKSFTNAINADFLHKKEAQNEKLIESIKNVALCRSNHKEFDHYLSSSYLDNVLRGGYPYSNSDGLFSKDGAKNGVNKRNNSGLKPAGSNKVYYIFSRKHGDLERDYNRFKLLPSYFSEGEGNYRDVNQNRRIDLFFNPAISAENIVYFLNLIKIDGYNPLVVRGERLYFEGLRAKEILGSFGINNKRLRTLMHKGFHFGEFFKALKEEGIDIAKKESLAWCLLNEAKREPVSVYGEGFWIDHWRYNLDLIENFLYFFPDKLKELFLLNAFCFWDDEYRIKERRRRYTLKDGRLYQFESVDKVKEKHGIIEKRSRFKHFLRTKDGDIYRTHLVEKMLSLILNKSATIDPQGIGVEMEADKPGWCDSLNGLPALFGSSICETFEIKRACIMLIKALEHLKKKKVLKMKFNATIAAFLNGMEKILDGFSSKVLKLNDYEWWDKSNSLKERFRKDTFFNISSKHKYLEIDSIVIFLNKLIAKLDKGIKKAKDKESGVHYTYFMYIPSKITAHSDGSLMPLRFKKRSLPLFLEGPVHALRVESDPAIYHSLKKSSLFDKKLKMYRLNASLKDMPLEIGRSRIFVPGWLENESIWLHMEYKYLLETLKAGLYKEFFGDFFNCYVCFFDPKVYGRSTAENSSFIVSSVYPDRSLWGRGFVARLSGTTVEALNIWMVLCLGRKPFCVNGKGELNFKFSPILKGSMFTGSPQKLSFKGKDVVLPKNSFAFKLFSSTLVVYHNPSRKDTFKNNCKVRKIIVLQNSKKKEYPCDTLNPFLSSALRERKIERVDVFFD
ncbi:MAG: hypothetical protein ABH872_06455 [Candidatus Omnitrophota bacterium]